MHQIELELQNEELREARGELEEVLSEVTTMKDQLEVLVAERTAELVRANEQALAASRAKATFLAMMSHELRTPMNGILGLVDVVRRRSDDPKSRAHLEMALRAGRHLTAILADILDIASLEGSRLTLSNQPFSLGGVLQTLRETLSPAALERGLTLRTTLDAELLDRTLLGDAPRLGQILLNLTSNAIQHTSSGEVSVSASLVSEAEGLATVRFEVRDTGTGIAPESLGRLFEPFEQLDGSSTRTHGGIGLGLAISRHLARRMGGDVGVESELGVGSLFWAEVRLGTG